MQKWKVLVMAAMLLGSVAVGGAQAAINGLPDPYAEGMTNLVGYDQRVAGVASLVATLSQAEQNAWMAAYNDYLSDPTSKPQPTFPNTVDALSAGGFLREPSPWKDGKLCDPFAITVAADGRSATLTTYIPAVYEKLIMIYLPTAEVDPAATSGSGRVRLTQMIYPPQGAIGTERFVRRDGTTVSGTTFLPNASVTMGDNVVFDFTGGAGLIRGMMTLDFNKPNGVIDFSGGNGTIRGIQSAIYRGQELDDRFVNVTGDTITGPLTVEGLATLNDVLMNGNVRIVKLAYLDGGISLMGQGVLSAAGGKLYWNGKEIPDSSSLQSMIRGMSVAYADNAGTANYATSAGTAGYATSAGTANYASDSDKLDGHHWSELITLIPAAPKPTTVPGGGAWVAPNFTVAISGTSYTYTLYNQNSVGLTIVGGSILSGTGTKAINAGSIAAFGTTKYGSVYTGTNKGGGYGSITVEGSDKKRVTVNATASGGGGAVINPIVTPIPPQQPTTVYPSVGAVAGCSSTSSVNPTPYATISIYNPNGSVSVSYSYKVYFAGMAAGSGSGTVAPGKTVTAAQVSGSNRTIKLTWSCGSLSGSKEIASGTCSGNNNNK